MKSFQLQLNVFSSQIEKTIAADLSLVRDVLLHQVLEHALLNGGKRIRPVLTLLSGLICRAGQEEQPAAPREELCRLAICFEYLHCASLLHDDVIDNAEKRRGRPAAHTVYGVTPAILAGDYLHARAMHLALAHGGPPSHQVISKATAAMIEAEFLQLQNAGNLTIAADDYFTVLTGKTASLISAACEAGAIWAGDNSRYRQAFSQYGAHLGIAFQIIDDLLDYQGDPGDTGKKCGTDFVEGKVTLPLLYALQKASDEERRFFSGLSQFNLQSSAGAAVSDSIMAENLQRTRQIIGGYNGFETARQYAEKCIESALQALEIFPDGEEKAILAGLARYVLSRKK